MKQAMPIAVTSPISTKRSGLRSVSSNCQKPKVDTVTMSGPTMTNGRKPMREAKRPLRGASSATVTGGSAVSSPAASTE